MASKPARAEARTDAPRVGSPGGQKPLNVMSKDGSREETAACGCSDLRHPHLPYWHPLNGPFPSD